MYSYLDKVTQQAQASTRSMLRQSLYNYLQTDNSLTYSYPQIAQFRNYHDQHTIGKMDRVEQLINSPQNQSPAMLQWARQLNNSATLTSLADSNSQWMNNLLIDNIFAGNGDYTTPQLNDLRTLAVKCPYQDGKAVLQARTILSQYDTTIYSNDCEFPIPQEERSMIIEEEQQTDQTDILNKIFKLYPNPNNGNMLLDYSISPDETGEIHITNITGKLVSSYPLDNRKKQLLIENKQLENGIYLYHIVVNDRIVKSDKLIIIK